MKDLVHSLTMSLLLALAGFAAFAMPAAGQAGAPLKIVAFGDSLNAGYGLPAQATGDAILCALYRRVFLGE